MFSYGDIKKSCTDVNRNLKKVAIGGFMVMASSLTAQADTSIKFSFADSQVACAVADMSGESAVNTEILESSVAIAVKLDPQIEEELAEFYDYDENWDGEGASKVQEATIDNCREVLKMVAFANEYFDDMFATELGTICLQWYKKETDTLINAEISPNKLSFYYDRSRDEIIGFKPEVFGPESKDNLAKYIAKL